MSCLLDLPWHVLSAIYVLVSSDNPVSAWNLAFSCHYLVHLVHQDLKILDAVRQRHFVFSTRCRNVLDGLYEYKAWYCNRPFRQWLQQAELSIGRDELVGLMFRLFRLEMIEILTQTSPPMLQDLLTLTRNFPDLERKGVYICLVKVNDQIDIYIGTALDALLGFSKRFKQYTKLDYVVLPKFLQKLIDDKTDFEILALIPVAVLPHNIKTELIFGDLRIVALLIETLLMFWLRCFKKGGEYEKVMKYSSWTAEEWQFIRSNSVPSTQQEWPYGLAMSPEESKAAQAARKKKYIESEKGRATRAAYKESEAGKASNKRYWESEKGKATTARTKESRQTEQGQENKRANDKKYREGEKGVAYMKVKNSRARARKKIKRDRHGKNLTSLERESLQSLGADKLTSQQKQALELESEEE